MSFVFTSYPGFLPVYEPSNIEHPPHSDCESDVRQRKSHKNQTKANEKNNYNKFTSPTLAMSLFTRMHARIVCCLPRKWRWNEGESTRPFNFLSWNCVLIRLIVSCVVCIMYGLNTGFWNCELQLLSTYNDSIICEIIYLSRPLLKAIVYFYCAGLGCDAYECFWL